MPKSDQCDDAQSDEQRLDRVRARTSLLMTVTGARVVRVTHAIGRAPAPATPVIRAACRHWLSANCRKRLPSETTRSPTLQAAGDLVVVADPLPQRDRSGGRIRRRSRRRRRTAGSGHRAARRTTGTSSPVRALLDWIATRTYMSRLRISCRFSHEDADAVWRASRYRRAPRRSRLVPRSVSGDASVVIDARLALCDGGEIRLEDVRHHPHGREIAIVKHCVWPPCITSPGLISFSTTIPVDRRANHAGRRAAPGCPWRIASIVAESTPSATICWIAASRSAQADAESDRA